MLQVAFPALEVLELRYLFVASDIWRKNYDDNLSSFCKLKNLNVSYSNELKIVIPFHMLHRLQNLEYLSIGNCGSVISEVGTNDSNTEVCPLVALRHMYLEQLPSLTRTGLNSRDHSGAMTLYPNIETLEIYHCKSLRNVFLPSINVKDFMHLKNLCVVMCEMMTEIIGPEEQEITRGIMFPELTTLRLCQLPNLTIFWRYQSWEANIYKVYSSLKETVLTFISHLYHVSVCIYRISMI